MSKIDMIKIDEIQRQKNGKLCVHWSTKNDTDPENELTILERADYYLRLS